MTTRPYFRIINTTKPLPLFLALVVVAFSFFNIPQILFRDIGYNTTIHLAHAFVNGRLHVEPPVKPLDLINVEDRYYVPFPPAPALLMTPIVAVLGVDLNPLWITPLLGMFTALILYRLYHRLTGNDELSISMSAAMVFGTAYWLCVRYVFDTYLAHMLTVLVVALAFLECFGKQRGWIIGLCLGIGCASRQLTVFIVPFCLAVLWWMPNRNSTWWLRLKPVLGVVTVLGGIFCGLLWYNWIRFGSPLNSGYASLIEEDWYAYRLNTWGNFNWRYIPSNFLIMFVLGFSFDFLPPAYTMPVMSQWGTSLTYASPFLFFAFRGRLPGPAIIQYAGWLCIVPILVVILMYKSAVGAWQINGIRYALDFLPLLSLFAVMGMKQHNGPEGSRWRRLLITYAIGLNLLAIAITHSRTLFPS